MEGDTLDNIYINVLGRTKTDTGACVRWLFPEESDTGQLYRRFPLNIRAKHAVENEDKPRMMNLKEHRLSESSSTMDTDSLPDYDTLNNDGGDAGYHDGGHRMTNLKAASYTNTSVNGPVSLPSTSASSGHRNTEPGTSYSTKASGQLHCHLLQIDWDQDKGRLWATVPICSSVFLLVIDVDRMTKNPGVPVEYLDMVKAIGDLCRHKGVHERDEYPTLYLLGCTTRTGNDATNISLRSMKKFRNEMSHQNLPKDCIVDSNDFLVNSDETIKDAMQLKRALTAPGIYKRSPSVNIPLARSVYDAIAAYKACTMDISSLQQKVDDVDRSSLVKTIQYLHSNGLVVFIGANSPIWIRPDILTHACAILCQISPGDLTKRKITSRLNVQLKLKTSRDTDMCLKALEKLGILAYITGASENGESSYTNSYGDSDSFHEPQYILSLKIETNNDDPFNKLQAKSKSRYSDSGGVNSYLTPSPYQTPVLRLRPTLRERKPGYVFCNVCFILVQKGLKPVVKEGNVQIFRNCAVFIFPSAKGRTRIFLSINNTNLHVVIVDFSNEDTINIDKCVKVRQDIENAILSVAFSDTDARDLGRVITREIRCSNSTGALNGTDGWNSVDSLKDMLLNLGDSGNCDQHEDSFVPHSIKPSEMLQMWFPTPANSTRASSMEMTDDEMSVSYGSPDLKRKKESQGPHFDPELKDGLLSKISKCFGSGWEQFFVENDVEQREVDTAKANNPNDMTKQVYCCLRFWKCHMKGKATVKMLKIKVKACDHLTFSFEQLEKIMAAEAKRQAEEDE